MIYKVITDDYYFWNWLENRGSYQNNFSLEGAKAVQAYFEELSEDLDINSGGIEFDPIAWCVEFSEYDSLQDAWTEVVDYKGNLEVTKDNNSDAKRLEYFQDNTTVIELDNGHIILGEF